MDPAKLKVTELRAELSARGLDTKGIKAVLVERLREALEEETGEDVPQTSIIETSTEDTSILEEKSFQYSEPEREASSDSEQVQPQGEQSPEQEREQDQASEAEQEQEQESCTQDSYGDNTYQSSEPVYEQDESQSQSKDQFEESQDAADRQDNDYYQDGFKEHYEEKPDVSQHQYDEEQYQTYNEKKENYEENVKMESDAEVKQEEDQTMKQEDQEQSYKQEDQDQPSKQEDDSHGDRKRKRSPQRQGWGQRDSWVKKDDEPDIDDEAMLLGWYDSDLNLEIDKSNFLEANPMSTQGFGYIWAGCRGTFGFNQGKVCYEVKLLENNDVTHLEDEPSPHVLRIGWSVLTSSMLLGEEPGSYGFGGTGKASTNCKFTNYGSTFVAGDTVTAYLDYGDADGDHVKISYAINGVHHGLAFNFPASDISHQPLFPHLLSKNIKFRVNFGQTEAEFPVEEGYTWAAQVPSDKREPGPRRPERREDCEMLMMCGLPGCGKTTWANAYVQENPGKFYNILGTNNLIDKMKIQGLPRKRNYHGRWDVLIDKCTKCLNKLLEMAARRRRNYILDQTNVYPSAQKRKMRNFAGFIRRAIVIVPTDEEFQRRCAKREAEEGKDIPDSAVLEMKANFRLPEVGESFDEVRFIELNEEESRPLVEQYNKEGRAAGFGQQAPFSGQAKRQRSDRPPFRGGGGGGFRGGRGGGFGRGLDRRDLMTGGRSQREERDRNFRSDTPNSKGGMERSGRGWQPRGGADRGPPRGGWRDRSPGFERDDRGPGGGPWRNDRNNRDRPLPYDRNQRGRGGRPGGYERDNFRGGYDRGFDRGGYEREEFPRGGGGGYNSRDGGFRDARGGGGRGGRGGFDRDRGSRGGGGFDRRGGGASGGFNERRGGGRDGGFDRNRTGDRGQRDNKGASNNQDGQNQGWGNQNYNSGGWGQYNQGGYNQGGFNQGGYNQGNQQGWGQQGWGANKGYGANNQQAQGTAATGAQAATGYNTAGYGQQAGYTQQQQQQYAQGYWGQYGYGQGWTQNADGTYSYPQGWQQYGYNYGQTATPAMAAQATGAAAAPAAAPNK